MRKSLRSRPTRGLTLLEVLFASVLLALLFSSIFTIVMSTIRTRDVLNQQAVPFAVGPAVMQRVVDDLNYAQLDAIKDDDGFRGSLESVSGGDAARVDFVTAVPSRDQVEVRDALVRAQLNEVGYRLHRSDLGGNLQTLYRREDLGVDDEPLEGGKYYKLCDRVKSFTVDYFEEEPKDPSDELARGVSEWDAKKEKRLPWGCRITLILEGPPRGDQDLDLDLPTEFVFTAYVAFRSRHDQGDKKP